MSALRWWTRDAERQASSLAAALGIRVERRPDGWALPLVNGSLVVSVPDGDADPAPARSRTDRGERISRDDAVAGIGAAFDAATAPACALVAVGIATVDTERFAVDRGWQVRALPRDPLLGATVTQVEGDPGTVLLEPDTEGRLAASLARFGEGIAALYLAPLAPGVDLGTARAAAVSSGVGASAVAAGPFGPAFALGGRPAWGPHVVICASNGSRTRTIVP